MDEIKNYADPMEPEGFWEKLPTAGKVAIIAVPALVVVVLLVVFLVLPNLPQQSAAPSEGASSAAVEESSVPIDQTSASAEAVEDDGVKPTGKVVLVSTDETGGYSLVGDVLGLPKEPEGFGVAPGDIVVLAGNAGVDDSTVACLVVESAEPDGDYAVKLVVTKLIGADAEEAIEKAGVAAGKTRDEKAADAEKAAAERKAGLANSISRTGIVVHLSGDYMASCAYSAYESDGSVVLGGTPDGLELHPGDIVVVDEVGGDKSAWVVVADGEKYKSSDVDCVSYEIAGVPDDEAKSAIAGLGE